MLALQAGSENIILDGSTISFVDSVGLKLLAHLLLKGLSGRAILLANPNCATLNALLRGDVLDKLGKMASISHMEALVMQKLAMVNS